jgi:copper transport protein
LLAVVGFHLATRDRRQGWLLALLGAAGLAIAPALSGHAVAAERVALTVTADALHVVGAGGWLGSLLMLLFAGVPVAMRMGGDRDRIVAALVHAFSPAALGFAALLGVTGLFSAWQHLGTFGALFSSDYGSALLLKLGALVFVIGLGAYNQLRLKPSLGNRGATARLRRSAGLELAMAALVLLLTAVLVATPPPDEGFVAAVDSAETSPGE